jgi:hypothetical protein
VEKVVTTGMELVSICSSDGWYWNINQHIGDICAKKGRWDIAAEQYDLALQGIRKKIGEQTQRLEALFVEGCMMKPDNFISWEDQALKPQESYIRKLEDLLEEARSH